MSKNGSILALMDKFLEDARAETKKAGLDKDAGRGDTSHPVMSADNGTKPANEGERGKENDADIRKNLGEVGNSGQRDASSASSTKPTDSIGTMKMDASEVKGNVQTPKADKEAPAEKGRGDASPGHPTNATFSEKYSSVIDLGNKILASLAMTAAPELKKRAEGVVSENAQKKVPAVPAPGMTAKHEDKETPAEEKKEEECKKAEAREFEKKAAAEKHTEDAEAGYLAAQLLATELGFIKGAGADAAVDVQVNSIVKSAEEDAENLVAFLNSHAEGMVMAARERAALTKRADPDSDPAAEAGGEMGMEGGEAGMEGGGDDAAIEQIAQLLAQAGITPEQLEAALAAEEGGGAPEEGGEIPAEALAAAAGGAPGGAPGV